MKIKKTLGTLMVAIILLACLLSVVVGCCSDPSPVPQPLVLRRPSIPYTEGPEVRASFSAACDLADDSESIANSLLLRREQLCKDIASHNAAILVIVEQNKKDQAASERRWKKTRSRTP